LACGSLPGIQIRQNRIELINAGLQIVGYLRVFQEYAGRSLTFFQTLH
jgi:hypothetical protein